MNYNYNFIPKFSPHGLSIILICIVFVIFFSFISSSIAFICLLITIFCLYFFRDPDRKTFDLDGLITSPGDGVVTAIQEVDLFQKFGISRKVKKISIFLSVFDVHVTRSPIKGRIKNIIYMPGKFISATNDKESDDNESNTLIIEDNANNEILITQIAGLIARRIICTAKVGDTLSSGERFGIIKFGSRLNVYVPLDYQLLIQEGQRVIGGETILSTRNSEILKNLH